MIFTELLKKLGLPDEQITAITGEMSKTKLFITNEEKIEERYKKLKLERDNLKDKLSKADTTIEYLEKSKKDNEILQEIIRTHDTTIARMKNDYENNIRDLIIDSAIQAKLTDTKYAELLKGKFDRTKLTMSDEGTVVGIDGQLKIIKETYKELFTPNIRGKIGPNNKGYSSSAK